MREVRLPRLLDGDLGEVRRLYPVQCSITLNLTGVSEATLVLKDGDEPPPMHSFVELYTVRGSAGIFRVTNIAPNYRNEITVTLRHGIDTLSDNLWRAQETWSGTVTQFLTRLLTFQTGQIGNAAPWALGSCACASSYTDKEMNYDRLSNLTEAIEGDESDYYFAFDQTAAPWTVSLLAKPSTLSAEFRLRRNAKGVTVTLDDSEMANRLRLSANKVNRNAQGKKTSVDTVYKDYNNAASQAAWGIIEKVADIEVSEDVKNGAHAECDAWAARFLSERADPSVQIEIDGVELKRYTGDSWDEPQLGQLCRVALPDYGKSFTERVVSLTWDDVYNDPDAVRVSLSNVLPRFSETLAKIQKQTARAGGAAGRAARDAEIASYWNMIVQKIEEAVNGTGLQTLWETGIVLDAESGATIYSLMAGLEALNSVLKITHSGVNSLVSVGGCQLDSDGNLVLDPDTGLPVFLPGNNLYSMIDQTATKIESTVVQTGVAAGVLPFDSSRTSSNPYSVGDLVIYNNHTWRFVNSHHGAWDPSDVVQVPTLSSRVSQTESSWSATVSAIGSNGSISAASIVLAINNAGSSVIIDADHVDVTGILTASGLITQTGYAGTIKASTMEASTLNGGTVEAGTLKLAAGNTYMTVSRNAYKVDGVTQNDTILMCGSSVLDIPATYIKTITKNTAGDTLTITDSEGNVTTFSKPQSAVTLDDPTWGTPITSNTNTFTVNASNGASKSQAVYLDQGSWSDGSKYVYLSHTNSSSSNRVAQLQVSIPTSWTYGSMGSGSSGTSYTVHKEYSVSKGNNYCWFTVNVGGLTRRIQIHMLS